MSVALLIVTHDGLGSELMETAVTMLGVCPLETRVLEVPANSDPEAMTRRARELVREIDQGNGVLVLTDVYGSTPSNIANRLQDNDHIKVIAGVNLPMLIRILNYPRLGLDELVDKALSGGRDGILLCEPATVKT